MPTSLLTITTCRHRGTVRITAVGEIDMATSGTLRQAIIGAVGDPGRGDTVIVDLAAVTFLDCAGITALLAGRDLAVAGSGDYYAVNAHGITRRVLQIFDLETVLAGTP